MRPRDTSERSGTYTSIDHADLDALAGDTRIPELVDLRHQMRRKGVVARLALRNRLLDGVPGRMDDVVRHRVAAHREDVLDLGQLGHLGRQLVGILGVLELNGRALE